MKEKIRSTRLRMCFRKMPPAVCFLTLFALCFGALSVRAADPSGRVALTAVRMQRAGGQVYVSFAVKIAPRAVRARHRWVITPCLGNASDSVLLGPFVVTGRIMAREENQRRLLAGLPDRDVNHLLVYRYVALCPVDGEWLEPAARHRPGRLLPGTDSGKHRLLRRFSGGFALSSVG